MQGGFAGYFRVTVISLLSGSSNCSDHSKLIDHTNTVITSIRYIEVSLTIKCYSGRGGNAGSVCWTVIAHKEKSSIPGHGRDDALSRNSANAIVFAICYVQIPLAIKSNTKWLSQLRFKRWTRITSKTLSATSCVCADVSFFIDNPDAVVGSI